MLQMVGRAGRPQFDTEGVAVIMTQKQVLDAASKHWFAWLLPEQYVTSSALVLQFVPRYEQLVTGSETVESALKDMLPEFLNAEIALQTITDVAMAIEWLRGTFFYIRVRVFCNAWLVCSTQRCQFQMVFDAICVWQYISCFEFPGKAKSIALFNSATGIAIPKHDGYLVERKIGFDNHSWTF